MAMVNQIAANPTMGVPYNLANMKDSRWLTLEVCREFQRTKCSRTETECKFAHPPPNVEVQNGRVTCCFDSIKGKCQRKDPPCKYLHPPQHLREQLLQNGKNNLILRNLQMQVAQFGLQPMVPTNVIPFAHHYPSPVQTAAAAYNPYSLSAATGMPTSVHGVNQNDTLQTCTPVMSMAGSGTQVGTYEDYYRLVASPAAPKVTRPDRLEVCREWQRASCTRSAAECRFAHPPDHVSVDSSDNQVTVCMDFIKGKCCRDTCRYFHPPQHLANQIKAAQQRLAVSQPMGVPAGLPAGLVPCMKRPALADKCTGLPTMYQQTVTANNVASYHQAAALAAMQFQGSTFVPVSFTGHPPSLQRF